ncbi:hypothetical protein AK830_g10543 [Neonectria ditissima]|uniref:CBM-cenC domain-containing protein n=1 Tax=Neonectria ditissima TaxID=78410 RepID=A0A0N8H5F4_9HYPO|nr:hypothetical protein AK830_g10543 [Neonectria ditissima]
MALRKAFAAFAAVAILRANAGPCRPQDSVSLSSTTSSIQPTSTVTSNTESSTSTTASASETTTSTDPCNPSSLLFNGNFDTNAQTNPGQGWTAEGTGGFWEGDARSDPIKRQFNIQSFTGLTPDPKISQVLHNLQPGEEYEVQYWYQIPTMPPGGFTGFAEDDECHLKTTLGTEVYSGDLLDGPYNVYRRRTATFTPLSADETFSIGVTCEVRGESVSVTGFSLYIDDVAFTKTPPTSLCSG